MLTLVLGVVTPLLTWSLLLLICLWCWFQWTHRELLRAAATIPTTLSALPFLGHAHYTIYGMDRVAKWGLEMSTRALNAGLYTTCFWCGPLPLIVVQGAHDIKKIMNSSITSEKSDEINYLKYALGDGLLTAPADTWKVTRRHISPLFHPRNVQQLLPVFNHNCRELVSRLSQHVGGTPVDLMDHTMPIALTTVCHLIFGPDMEFDTQSEEFRGLMQVVEKIPDIFSKRTVRVWLRVDAIFQFLYKKELEEINKLWAKFTEAPLKLAKSKLTMKLTNCSPTESNMDNANNSEETGPLNLLDAYSVLQKGYPQFTEEELKSEMITLYCTGTDTVGVAVASCLLLLAQHQDIQERVYHEICSVTGPDDDITMEELDRLPYLDQVYKETLRWSTIVPFISRKPSQDLQLSSCTIPAGSTILICLFGVHMDPKTYPDPQRFDPERFSTQSCVGQDRYTFLPYSGGPRNCIGKQYSQTLMKVMLIHVLRRYRLTTDMDVHTMRRKLAVTLVSAEGYKVTLHQRI